jgi:hypothetical protein
VPEVDVVPGEAILDPAVDTLDRRSIWFKSNKAYPAVNIGSHVRNANVQRHILLSGLSEKTAIIKKISNLLNCTW